MALIAVWPASDDADFIKGTTISVNGDMLLYSGFSNYCGSFSLREERMIEIGREAPDFCLAADDDETVCIKDFKGMWVVLYFYPKDSTSC